MKWKDFMKQVEKAGIKDEDEIWFIDFGSSWEDELVIAFEEKLGWHIS